MLIEGNGRQLLQNCFRFSHKRRGARGQPPGGSPLCLSHLSRRFDLGNFTRNAVSKQVGGGLRSPLRPDTASPGPIWVCAGAGHEWGVGGHVGTGRGWARGCVSGHMGMGRGMCGMQRGGHKRWGWARGGVAWHLGTGLRLPGQRVPLS